MLKPGSAAPDFSLPDQTGTERSLEDLLKPGPLVLYFYPADFTPVCTAEACMYRDHHADLARAGLSIAGVSAQSVQSHEKFGDKHSLPFALLADPGKKVIRAYGATSFGGLLPRRVTYLINQDKSIADAVTADLTLGKHRKFIDRAIASAAR